MYWLNAENTIHWHIYSKSEKSVLLYIYWRIIATRAPVGANNINFQYLNTGEFEALGYPKTLAIYLSSEASKVQGGRAGLFIQVTMTKLNWTYFALAFLPLVSSDRSSLCYSAPLEVWQPPLCEIWSIHATLFKLSF